MRPRQVYTLRRDGGTFDSSTNALPAYKIRKCCRNERVYVKTQERAAPQAFLIVRRGNESVNTFSTDGVLLLASRGGPCRVYVSGPSSKPRPFTVSSVHLERSSEERSANHSQNSGETIANGTRKNGDGRRRFLALMTSVSSTIRRTAR